MKVASVLQSQLWLLDATQVTFCPEGKEKVVIFIESVGDFGSSSDCVGGEVEGTIVTPPLQCRLHIFKL